MSDNQDIERMERELQPMARESDTLGVLQRAEVDQQISTAKRYPRSITKFMSQVRDLVSANEHIAQSCLYALPRDGKVIEGPSVRLAEILLSCWGNCKAGARTISEDDKWVTAQGIFYDLENNIAITVDTRRRITSKNGRRYNDDMIAMTANAASSIALRNAILRGVPRAYWEEAYEVARRVVMGDFKTLPTRRAAAIQAFVAYGISQEMMFAHFGIKGVEDMTGEHLVYLRGYITAIKEDGVVPESLFPPKEADGTPAPAALQAVKSEAEGAKPAETEKKATETTEAKDNKKPRAAKATTAPATEETKTNAAPKSNQEEGQQATTQATDVSQDEPKPASSSTTTAAKEPEPAKVQGKIDFGET